jgi:hypothetical protein
MRSPGRSLCACRQIAGNYGYALQELAVGEHDVAAARKRRTAAVHARGLGQQLR